MRILYSMGTPIFICVDFWGVRQTVFGSNKIYLDGNDFIERVPTQAKRLFKQINNI
jgi:hypothetical protein